MVNQANSCLWRRLGSSSWRRHHRESSGISLLRPIRKYRRSADEHRLCFDTYIVPISFDRSFTNELFNPFFQDRCLVMNLFIPERDALNVSGKQISCIVSWRTWMVACTSVHRLRCGRVDDSRPREIDPSSRQCHSQCCALTRSMTTSFLNVHRHSAATLATCRTDSTSSALTWKIGALTTRATSVQYGLERAIRGSVVKPIWMLRV